MTAVPPQRATGLADGDWHRLHPATPLLRGGIGLIAVLGLLVANLRERLIDSALGGRGVEEDPLEWLLREGLLGIAALAGLAVLGVVVLAFWLSWRMHSFRITEEAVEVRSGIVFRTSRKARLDRIQGVNIARPFLARLFGAARLEISQAGNDANVQLAYLTGANADALRREVLRLASGARAHAVAEANSPASGSLIGQRVQEFLAPELDPDAAPPESVVRLHPGRLAGSVLLSETAVIAVLLLAGFGVVAAVTRELLPLIGVVPTLLGMGGYLVSRFTRSLRYSIAGTPDGVRVGFGLLSTSNETLPPGRVHSVQVSQSLLWRPFGWWQVRVNKAAHSSARSAPGQENTTLLPVGDAGDVARVLALVLPGLDGDALARHALVSPGGDDGFTNSPRRARWVRWFSWRRNGFALTGDSVLLRKGAIWRELVVVPLPRIQSVGLSQGPLARSLGLARIHAHTVAGPISATLGAVDKDAAVGFFTHVAAAAVRTAAQETTHRWRSAEAGS